MCGSHSYFLPSMHSIGRVDHVQYIFFNTVQLRIQFQLIIYETCVYFKVSVQGVVALGGNFATLCQELIFMKHFFFIINFEKRKGKFFYTFNHSIPSIRDRVHRNENFMLIIPV